MRMAFIGSHIWMLGPHLVELSGKWWRCSLRFQNPTQFLVHTLPLLLCVCLTVRLCPCACTCALGPHFKKKYGKEETFMVTCLFLFMVSKTHLLTSQPQMTLGDKCHWTERRKVASRGIRGWPCTLCTGPETTLWTLSTYVVCKCVTGINT